MTRTAVVPIRPPEVSVSPALTVAAITSELESLGRLESGLAAAALVLAARLDSGAETGSALAAVSRELRAVMDAARVTGRPASAIDELRSRRDAKWAGIA